jgi:hypothetical protein
MTIRPRRDKRLAAYCVVVAELAHAPILKSWAPQWYVGAAFALRASADKSIPTFGTFFSIHGSTMK